LISEVVYDPLLYEPDSEWIELYNPTDEEFDIGGYLLGDEKTPGGNEGMYRFPEGILILPGQALVIAREAEAFRLIYGFLPDFELHDSRPEVPELEPVPTWGSGMLNLGNAGDEVLLMDPDFILVDALSWGTHLLPSTRLPRSSHLGTRSSAIPPGMTATAPPTGATSPSRALAASRQTKLNRVNITLLVSVMFTLRTVRL
jgi:hypothetical protein